MRTAALGEEPAAYTWNLPICPYRVSIDLCVVEGLQQEMSREGGASPWCALRTDLPDPHPDRCMAQRACARPRGDDRCRACFGLPGGRVTTLSAREARSCFRPPKWLSPLSCSAGRDASCCWWSAATGARRRRLSISRAPERSS